MNRTGHKGRTAYLVLAILSGAWSVAMWNEHRPFLAFFLGGMMGLFAGRTDSK